MNELNFTDPKYWPEDYRRPWHIVTFNAWRHQHVKPPWWVFYQTIRRQCMDAVRDEAKETSGISSPKPMFAYRHWIDRLAQRVWIWATEIFWRLFTPEVKTKSAIAFGSIIVVYAIFSSGLVKIGEKGLQLKDASPQDIWVASLVMLLGLAPTIWALVAALTRTLLPGTPDAAQNYSMGAGDPLDRFRKHFDVVARRFNRPILVIVDDLDRCDPAYVVDLVRGMQTILVSPRVVFVLLGDRDWIEEAFAQTYQTMKTVEVGPEQEFGARFVEKAIQFTFVLTDISPEARRHYVRKLLGLTNIDEKDQDTDTFVTREIRDEVDKVIAHTDYAEREKAAERLRTGATIGQLNDVAKEAAIRDLDIKLSLRASTDQTAIEATQHMLEALAPALPANPRQIKRIVNIISFMQEVARLEGFATPGSPEWQILARWVVLMTEWPKTWFTLSRDPSIADLLYQANKKITKPVTIVEAIKGNKQVMKLLTFESDDNGWTKRDITSKEIEWLRALMPPASGKPLKVGAPESATSANS